ncbi:hypothetical protein CEXT_363101 [Caerostris extrusa]|uniref:Uncharacterized protein n=1 Tax=Caerostris extrusa TaxID=172846 RepID=A0AAV4T0S6_CAEEX|nr:hypothetical protein CEXT_363101 [Caerostris extrusa]
MPSFGGRILAEHLGGGTYCIRSELRIRYLLPKRHDSSFRKAGISISNYLSGYLNRKRRARRKCCQVLKTTSSRWNVLKKLVNVFHVTLCGEFFTSNWNFSFLLQLTNPQHHLNSTCIAKSVEKHSLLTTKKKKEEVM